MQVSLPRFRILCSAAMFTLPWNGARAADALPTGIEQAPPLAPNEFAPTLRIGGYFGALTEQSLIGVTVTHPWRTRFQADYLVDAHAIATAYRFTEIPLDIEIEGGDRQAFRLEPPDRVRSLAHGALEGFSLERFHLHELSARPRGPELRD